MSGAEIQEEVTSRLLNGIQMETVQLTGQNPVSYLEYWKKQNNYLLFPDDLRAMFSSLNPEYTSTITWQNNMVKECILPSYHSKNLKILEAAFLNEVTKRNDYLVLDKTQSKNIFDKNASLIAELPFIDATVELTKGNGFKFILFFPKNKLLMISKSLNQQNHSFGGDEIIYSLFINNELIASNTDELENFKEGFRKYLSM
jgi:hypothetical protein